MTLDLSYLTAPTRELAFQDAKARIRLVQTARWVGYPRAGVAVEELERRFNYPTCARMPCMLLYGDSGMGKSMILEKMERQHPSSYDQRRGITKRPVVIVQMPSSPDQRRFYTRILQVLGAPYSTHEELGVLEARVIDLLQKVGTQLLCIEEVHHLLAGSHREQRKALNLLKFLANELKIVVVAVGTSDAFHALQTDVQVASRFEPLMSPPLLLGVLEREASAKTATPGTRNADRLHDSAVADRIAVLGQLSNSEINALWPPPTRWELQDRGFCSYCPYCCLDDLGHHRTPYGRRCWQQSWCTICNAHGAALVVRKQTHVSSNRSLWSHAKLKSDREFLAPDRYRDLKVAREPMVRSTLLGCLLHLERTTAAALSGIAPDAWS
jgi:uncharacterized coiled-coil protein SlyX